MAYTPIKSLNTFAKEWCIKARITNKIPLRTTARGTSLLKIELLDAFGTQIEGTFFGDAADRFDPILIQEKVYFFSNGQVKASNPRFSNLDSLYELVFERYSSIVETFDDGSIMLRAFDFLQIAKLEGYSPAIQRPVDLVGIVANIEEAE